VVAGRNSAYAAGEACWRESPVWNGHRP